MTKVNSFFTKICEDNLYNEAFELGFNRSLLDDEKEIEVLDFITDHYAKHSKSPSLKRLMGHFTSVIFTSTEDSLTELVDDIRSDSLHRGVYALIHESGTKLKQSKNPEQARKKGREALTILRRGILELESEYNPSKDIKVNSQEFKEKFLSDFDDRSSNDGIQGIPSPWETYNTATQGSMEGDLIMLVARSGVGKTWTTLAMVNHAWDAGKGSNILLVSNEIQLMKMANRMVAHASHVSYDNVKKGNTDKRDRLEKLLSDYQDTAADFIISGSDDDMSAGGVASVEAKINKYSPDIVFIDGAYLLSDDMGAKAAHEKAGNIIRSLKKLAKRRKLPIVISWQLNRKATETSGDSTTIGLTDVAGQDSDVIIGLFQTEDMKLNREMLIKSLKVREGASFEFRINWDFGIMDFTEIVGYDDDDPIAGPDDGPQVTW